MELEVGLCALIDFLSLHLSPEGVSVFLTSLQGPIRMAMVIEKCTEHTLAVISTQHPLPA